VIDVSVQSRPIPASNRMADSSPYFGWGADRHDASQMHDRVFRS
jgi:hypothetical protein